MEFKVYKVDYLYEGESWKAQEKRRRFERNMERYGTIREKKLQVRLEDGEELLVYHYTVLVPKRLLTIALFEGTVRAF